ncbi:MAG: DUF6320 domain-containing protein [Acholeplasmatales bacterium]|jgi:O-antigen/teichoic acid export membrane protein|nr:DUF6320 domain-containing protein [Acholeplasmatales bacterium]
MKYCKKCGVHINLPIVQCPLCKSILEESDNYKVNTYYQRPPAYKEKKRKPSMILRILFLLSIVFIGIALVINLLFYKELPFQGLWSIPLLFLVAGVWNLVAGCIKDHKHFNYYFLLLLVCVGCLLGSAEYLAYYNLPNYFVTILYVVPALCMVFYLTLGIRSLIKKKYYQDDFIYLFLSVLFNIIYMIVFVSIDLFTKQQTYTIVFSSVLAGIVLLAMFLIATRRTIQQFKKIFFI